MSTVFDLIQATVRLEQPIGNGQATVGTGFVVVASTPDGAPRKILITANHVFASMPKDKAAVGFRHLEADGRTWRFAPINVRIRNAEGRPLWTRHPTQDVAAIELPNTVSAPGVPARELPGERALDALQVRPGDEMMVLGYPRGFAANRAGFPILRSGRVASFPLSPADKYPTYMLDFAVFAGNSGGPVYLVRPSAAGPRAGKPQRVVITGLLTQQIKIRGDRLEIGNVTQADFISETVSLLGARSPTEISGTLANLPESDAATAASTPPPSSWERLREAWRTLVEDFAVLLRRAWIVARDQILAWVTPDANRTKVG